MKHLSGKGSLAQIFLGAPFLFFYFLLCHLSFLAGILVFWTLHLGLTLMRPAASYLYEGLIKCVNFVKPMYFLFTTEGSFSEQKRLTSLIP